MEYFQKRKVTALMDKKVDRIISLYNRLADGEAINKADEAARFEVNERTIQRDIDDIRAYYAEDPEADRELVYDRARKGYVLVQNTKENPDYNDQQKRWKDT